MWFHNEAMIDRLLSTVKAALFVGIACWAQIGVCQEHFLSEMTYREASPPNKGIPEPGHLTVLGLTLDKHTVEDATRKLGKADPIDPHMHHELHYICYRSALPGDNTVLSLAYDPDVPKRSLESFQIIAGSERFRSRKQCAKSLLVTRALSTQSGVALGISPVQAKQIWAIPSREWGTYLIVSSEYYEERVIEGIVRCNRMVWNADGRFDKGRLTWLQVGIGGEMIRKSECPVEEERN